MIFYSKVSRSLSHAPIVWPLTIVGVSFFFFLEPGTKEQRSSRAGLRRPVLRPNRHWLTVSTPLSFRRFLFTAFFSPLPFHRFLLTTFFYNSKKKTPVLGNLEAKGSRRCQLCLHGNRHIRRRLLHPLTRIQNPLRRRSRINLFTSRGTS